jgi:NAD-dependent SIR2 family protein deacetylase
MLDEYYCNDCKEIFPYNKPYGETFPENPKCPKCENTNTKRNILNKRLVVPNDFKSVNQR